MDNEKFICDGFVLAVGVLVSVALEGSDPYRRRLLRRVNMTAVLLGFGCIFFVMGHSILLFYKSENVSSMPLVTMLFPWPRKGRIGSFFGFLMALACLALMFILPSDIRSGSILSTLKILIILVLFPIVMHVSYLIRRVRKTAKGLYYFPSEATRTEWAVPFLACVICYLLAWIFN